MGEDVGENGKHLYEGMYVIRANISEDARHKVLEKIKEGIQDAGGEILKEHELGRKRLAYEIGRQREGFYFLFFFTLPPGAVEGLWQAYHINEDLLRFMTLRTEKVLDKIEFKVLAEQ